MIKIYMTIIMYIAVVKCVNGYPKTMLDVGSAADVMLQSPGLHGHLASILSILYCGHVFHTSTVDAKGNCSVESTI
jgi:hypothetical protein